MSVGTTTPVKAWAVEKQGDAKLVPFEFKYEKELLEDEVEIQVESCGVCHTDLSMIDNDWGFTAYPFVGGHEVIGKVVAVGAKAAALRKVGERVGVGYFSKFCGLCNQCIGGHQEACNNIEGTINGRHGGFAERVRCGATAAILIPEGVNPDTAGPLLCAGNTVFAPLISFGVKSSAKVGVVGIGGLGHLAIKFYKAWGCSVTAFTSEGKFDEAKAMGADTVVNSRSPKEIGAVGGQYDFILYTPNVEGPWDAYVAALAPRGRLNFVGIPPKVEATIFGLLGEKSISGSGQCSPVRSFDMLKFAARHSIEPTSEVFPVEKINDAIDKLRDGTIRFRGIVKF